jgi:carbonic anhydrase
MSNWSYQNYGKWPSMYNQCSIKNNPKQSPINIVSDDIIQECEAKCQVILKYKPSRCYLVNDHNVIVINYDPGSYLIYQNNWYQLTKAKIHTPSLHTMNGQTYAAEVCLYHCDDTQCKSGIIISIFLNRGPDYGESVDFINQFINQVPLISTPVEREIEVANNWNIISLIPAERAAFVYDGSLPHPPCTSGWKWIIFNEPSTIGMSALKTLTHNVVTNSGPTNRPAMNVKDTSNIYRIPHRAFKIFEERPIATPTPTVDPSVADELVDPNNKDFTFLSDNDPNMFTRYYMDYKKLIYKGLLICLFILTLCLAIKTTKYLIKNDLVNKALSRGTLGFMSGTNTSQTVQPGTPQGPQQPGQPPQGQPQPGGPPGPPGGASR